MSIGIIGAGRLGSAIARTFAKRDVPALIANSRGPDSLVELTKTLGPSVVAASLAEVLKADKVVLAVPWMALKNMLIAAPAWSGRILIDATNPVDYVDPNSPDAQDPTNPLAKYGAKPVDIGSRTSSEIVAELAPGAKVVKAFNHVNSSVIRDPEVANGQRVLFISGDDQAAKEEVTKLLELIGFYVRDLGSLAVGGRLQGAPFGSLSSIDFVRI
jgi:8-hydroxy-5-deazaflavin:NADPH oxidoreductase